MQAPRTIPYSSIFILALGICSTAIVTSACQPITSSPTEPTNVIPIQTRSATEAPSPTSATVRTPPALPQVYLSTLLNPLDVPREYIRDGCQYLRDKWNPKNATPGTVVMVIVFNSINRGTAESTDAITVKDFIHLMENLKRQDFEAINTEQLADFLEHNAPIPPRSVLLSQDGRRYADNFNSNFREYYAEWGWPVVNAWAMRADTAQSLWQENIDLENEGWVDHQLYSPFLNINEQTSTDYLKGELDKDTASFKERFSKSPVAIIWNGPTTSQAVQAAHRSGFRLGFTANSRGPIMFNWIPQANQSDLKRPSYFPEGNIGNPLMTLPRYWPYQAFKNIDAVRVIGQEAAAYAEQNKATELEYYDIACAPTYGPIP